jgi:hypothetical protein
MEGGPSRQRGGCKGGACRQRGVWRGGIQTEGELWRVGMVCVGWGREEEEQQTDSFTG